MNLHEDLMQETCASFLHNVLDCVSPPLAKPFLMQLTFANCQHTRTVKQYEFLYSDCEHSTCTSEAPMLRTRTLKVSRTRIGVNTA